MGVLEDKELVLADRVLLGGESTLGTDGGHVQVVAALERDVLAVEAEDELGVSLGVGLQSTAGRQVGAVGGLESVLALGEEHQGDGGIIAPGDVLVGVQGTVGKVDVTLAVDVLDVDLGVHGELHNPEAVLGDDLGVGSQLLTIAAGIVAVRAEESPAAVGLDLDLPLLVGALALGITTEHTSGSAGEVAVEGAAEVDLAVGIGLDEPDLLALERAGSGVDAEAKGLGSEVVAGRVDEAEAPGKCVRHGLKG